MNQPLSRPSATASGSGDWMQDRLTEARGILADISQHRETLVILAARVVAAHSADAIEAANARDLWRRLAVVAQASCPQGGAA